jgi:glutathione S-transferase
VLELFQTEWCPGSRRIRQRLTELGLDYLNHQVPVEREERTALFGLTGFDTVPTLLLEDGSALVGEEEIRAHLEIVFVVS